MNKSVFIAFSLNNSSVSDYFTDLANTFSDEGYDVTVFSDKKPESNTLDKRIVVNYWPSTRPTKIKDFVFLYQKTRKSNPVLQVSMFGSVNVFLIVGFICKVRNRVAWISTLTTQFPQKKILLFRKLLVFKLSTKIIVNSQATMCNAAKSYNINESKISVFPNSVRDYNAILPKIKTDDKKITYVGRLHPSKGVDTLLKAFALLAQDKTKVYLDIIGDGPSRDELKKLAIDLQVKDKIVFWGNKSKMKVLKHLKSSYCSVVPSKSEAFGYTVIEAMSVGTCVIGADNTGIKEIIINNQSGLLFETGDYEDLAKKLKMITADKNFRDALANNGYERFLNFYENNRSVKRDFNYLRNLTIK